MAFEISDETFSQVDFTQDSALDAVDYIDCTFDSCNMQEVTLSHKTFLDCTFKSCNLSVAQVIATTFRGCTFKDCKLMGIDWSSASRLEETTFHNCVLTSASFMNRDLRHFRFDSCILREVDFADANLSQAKFDQCDLAGAIFRNTTLVKAEFQTAKNYDIDPRHNKIERAKFSLPEAVSLLSGLGIELV